MVSLRGPEIALVGLDEALAEPEAPGPGAVRDGGGSSAEAGSRRSPRAPPGTRLGPWPGTSSSPAGASAASTRRARSSASCRRTRARVTLVNDVNFLLYTPLLPGAAAGTLEPRHVVVPLREELKRTDLRLGTVTGADPGRTVLRVDSPAGRVERARATTSSSSRSAPCRGRCRSPASPSTDRLQDALRGDRAAQPRAAHAGDRRDASRIRRRARQWLTYVFVGAGYAGPRGARRAAGLRGRRDRPATRAAGHQGMRWILVEARDRVMPEIPPDLADFATRRAARRAASRFARARRSSASPTTA